MYGVKILVEMTEDFNNIKSNWSSKKPTLEDLKNQFKLIQEEVRELEEGLESNDTVEILDGALDVLVVTVGLLQQLEDAGLCVDQAAIETGANNLSKFPIAETTATCTQMHYDLNFPELDVKTFKHGNYYVFKDKNDKVRKPVGFKSNDLSSFIPEELKKGFKNAT